MTQQWLAPASLPQYRARRMRIYFCCEIRKSRLRGRFCWPAQAIGKATLSCSQCAQVRRSDRPEEKQRNSSCCS